MTLRSRLVLPATLVAPLAALAGQGGLGGTAGLGALFDSSRPSPISTDVTLNMGQPGFMATVKPGVDAWPGVRFASKAGLWDLRKYGHVEAAVINNSHHPMTISMRVENPGAERDKRWNTESVTIEPGKEKTVFVFFGYSDGMKKGYRLDPAKVSEVTLTARPVGGAKADERRGLIVTHLVAGGIRGERPQQPKSRADGFGGGPDR